MFCRNCGAEIPDGVYFCEKCGAKQKNSKTSMRVNFMKTHRRITQNPLTQQNG
ncbi:MAG: zinc ribbon domain-containing protein [Oscillospiraceae bacterium]|nr:zinc ribbon domain-containing protein [Oscillospiraceae bacterium]